MSEPQNKIGQVFIKVDGAELSPAVMAQLNDLVVEDDLEQPAMVVLRFNDQQYQLADGDTFKLGSELQLRAADPNGRAGRLLVAEVTALETEQEQSRTLFTVRGYDRSHRLHRGRKTRTFLNQSDSDIVAAIAREAGLRADVEASGVQHPYVIQDNQTDFAFIRARAARLGYRPLIEERTLKFCRAESNPSQAPEQKWGEQLLSVRTRRSAVAQPSEVQVRGWDHQAMRAIVGRASRAAEPSQSGAENGASQAATRAFGGEARLLITDQPVSSQAEADKLAQAVLDDVADDYLELEATMRGDPALRAGVKVKLSGIGRRAGGTYLITATRHELTPEGGYQTTCYVNGRRPNSLLGTLNEGRPAHGIQGVVVAIVTNNNDPQGQGRVKLKFPWLDDQQESFWARLAAPGAGKERGLYLLPEVNDEVLVAFEHGDISRPYVVGGLWNGRDAPPATALAGNEVQTRILKTRLGHMIELKDEAGSGGVITLKTKSGHTLAISDSDRAVTIRSQAGNEVAISDSGRSVSISSQGSISLESPGGKLIISESGVELSSNSMLKVQANAMLDVKTSAILTIQGSLVKIN